MPWLEELQGARPGVESNLRFLERRERAECGSELRGITALLAGPTPPGRDGLLPPVGTVLDASSLPQAEAAA